MPGDSSNTNILAGSAGGQSAQFCDLVVASMLRAGATRVLNLVNHNVGSARETLLRMPPLGPHQAYADYFLISNNNGGAIGSIQPVFDARMSTQSGLTVGAYVGSSGSWTTGAAGFPNTGLPVVSAIFGTTANATFPGATAVRVRINSSEYGIAFAVDFGSTQTVGFYFRPMDSIRCGRDIGAQSQQGAFTAAGQTHTFGAPTGQHLTIEIEGVAFNVTFPAVAINSFRTAQEITRQLGGFGEAYVRDLYPLAQGESVRIRITPDRAPVGGQVAGGGSYSTFRPRIRITYQDPSVIAAGVDFSLRSNFSATAVVTGALGTLQLSTVNWPAIGGRVGSVMYNRTRGNSASVVRYTTTTNPMDTMVLDNIPVAWVAGDTYDFLPCAEHADGVGAFGGAWQAVVRANNFSNLTQGAIRDIVLSDLYGEAFSHYQVGQTVFMANNGFCVVLSVNASPAGMRIGDTITNTTRGSTGIVRAIDTVGNRILVDTISGGSLLGTPYNGDPWASPDSVNATGVVVLINSVADNQASIGWMALAQVTAISQLSATDPRTVLTLDLTAANINAALALAPGFHVGVHAKNIVMQTWNLPGNNLPLTGLPNLINRNLGQDINRDEAARLPGIYPSHAPDFETYSYQLAEYLGQNASASVFGRDPVQGQFPHLRSVNAANVNPQVGDNLQEDMDANRSWIPIGMSTNNASGAGSPTHANNLICIGPGGVQ